VVATTEGRGARCERSEPRRPSARAGYTAAPDLRQPRLGKGAGDAKLAAGLLGVRSVALSHCCIGFRRMGEGYHELGDSETVRQLMSDPT
jgi:hypothetical protein